ncbi:MAG: hypothetical protein A2Z47_05570 [Thermodesulfovibrio sp. RBG_19FT_COMBO_42_12]|nr:MAG: hypothetical protein A2Z47_05570 [Thermodesulfovibrio sp. RBG_19FT_COMBO_42_12]
MLIIMKAKWYQREIENTLVRVISYARLEDEHRNITKNIFGYLIMLLKRLYLKLDSMGMRLILR